MKGASVKLSSEHRKRHYLGSRLCVGCKLLLARSLFAASSSYFSSLRQADKMLPPGCVH